MNFKIDIKSSDVLEKAKETIKKNLEDDLKKVVKTLGSSALKHAEDIAKDNLPDSLNNIYKENLYIEQLSDNIVVVGVRPEALWIEEGRKSGFMDELLKNGKTSKDGHKYQVIPFKKETGRKNTSNSGEDLVNELKGFLKSQGIRYSKTRGLALDDKGSPRVGKIHSFNIKDLKGKKKQRVQDLSKNLQGLSIFQNYNEKTGRVERDIMTFRVISEKHRGTGKWEHPGRQGEKILEKTYEWIEKTWQREILPELQRKYKGK